MILNNLRQQFMEQRNKIEQTLAKQSVVNNPQRVIDHNVFNEANVSLSNDSLCVWKVMKIMQQMRVNRII